MSLEREPILYNRDCPHNFKYTNKHFMPITKTTLRAYYSLTKPGIIYGNVLTAAGGFLYGSGQHIHPLLLLATVIGMALIIGSACVFNNYIDQDIDAVMARTSKRSLVRGDIPENAALVYASALGILGFAVLWIFVNLPTVILGIIGFVSYVALYTPSKRTTEYSTLIGSISGATPIAAGYTAAAGRFDTAALLLFVIMVIWQMPHFYAIAIFRRDEYAKAEVPILSVTRGIEHTKLHIIAYIVLFVLAVLGFALFGYASFSFFIIMAFASLYWLWAALQGLGAGSETVRWSRKVFGISLLMLLILSASLAVDYWLP